MKRLIFTLLFAITFLWAVSGYAFPPCCYDPSDVEIEGGTIDGITTLTMENVAGPSLLNEAATATNPTLIPNRADPDTGITWPAAAQVWGTVVTLSAANIKALKATPITLVVAQGANTWIELVSIVLTYDAGATPYTIANADDDLVVEWADGTDATASIESTGFLDQGDDEIRWYPPSMSAAHDGEASLNQALRILNTGTAELADGDGVIDVRITYRVWATGF